MIESATKGFVMNQTMLRVKDPKRSVEFYSNVLGMTMLDSYKFPAMKFSLYFMGYLEENETIPDDRAERSEWLFSRPALVELTHNWGTESDPSSKVTMTETKNHKVLDILEYQYLTYTKPARGSKTLR